VSMASVLSAITGLLCAMALLGSCAWFGYLLARRAWETAPASVRWAAAATVSTGELLVVLYALSILSHFDRWWGLCALLLLAVFAHIAFDGAGAIGALKADRDAALRVWSGTGIAERILLLGGGALVLARAVRSLVAPPLGQDALVYHLLRAGRWVQSGTITWENGPDVWRYLEAYPPASDLWAAWAFLATHDDLLVGIAGTVPLAMCGLAVYALARTMQAPSDRAVVAAALVMFCPALNVFVTSAYNDSLMLCMFLAGATFTARAVERDGYCDALVAGAAFGIGASVKITALAWLAVAMVSMAALLVSKRRKPSSIAASLAMMTLGSSIVGFALVRSWFHTGSPVYPFGIDLLGIHWPHDELWELVTSARLFAPTYYLPNWFLPRTLFLPGLWHGREEMGLGPAVLMVLPAALAALPAAWHRSSSRAALLVMGTSTLLLCAS
jgi:hypothetical protein